MRKPLGTSLGVEGFYVGYTLGFILEFKLSELCLNCVGVRPRSRPRSHRSRLPFAIVPVSGVLIFIRNSQPFHNKIKSFI